MDKLKVLKSLQLDSISLVILPGSEYENLNMDILKFFTKKKGAYLAVNRPYATLKKTMLNKGIKTNNLLFLDCVTGSSPKANDCISIKSARSLTNIGIALEKVYKNKNLSFIILDSLDALSIYHSTNSLLRFARSEIERIRENNMGALILLSYDETDKRIIDEMYMVCDKVVNLVD
jgi:archaellum biogenesis ATPase FlaH